MTTPKTPVFAGRVTIDTSHPEGECGTCDRLAAEAERNARADGGSWLSIDEPCAAHATCWEDA